jgi:tetratricopeptide (TPR) repeat protein
LHLKKAVNADDVTDDCYQLYGSVLEASGDTEGAMKAYDDGLTRFPNSGRLYITKGNAFAAKEEYGDAIVFYEKGIEVDPTYPANYVMATLLYCRLSEEEVWGMIYGEIYLNMPERNEEWAGPVSKILYDTYTSEITFPTDSTAGVSFSKNEITITDMSQLENLENLQLPFPLIAYETGLTVAAMFERSIDLASLDRIRSNFVNIYYDSGNDKTFPNVLFDYQKKVRDAGHMEAYNYWILQAGDTAAFTKWQENNRGKWDAFLAWRAENELVLDAGNRFYRRQY